MTILDILEQKFPFMTSVGDMPNMPWYVMPVCPSHRRPPYIAFFNAQKGDIALLNGTVFITSEIFSNG
ncbi:uncharacterized protein Dvar_27770 [Desulfosarcina variabilis str. Montpellier]